MFSPLPAMHRVLLLIALAAAVPATLFAQQASITGRVVDSSQGALPGATIVVTNLDTGIRTTATTDGEGYYRLPLLPPGQYSIAVDLTGFRSQTKTGIALDVQQTARFDFTLDLGTLSETVDVRTPLVETQTSSLGHVIDNTRVRELPLNGRNPLELTRLTPGVTLLATAFLDTRNFNLTSMSINGGQGGTNAMLLDGGSTTLPERNEYSVAPSVDAVQEFRVQTNALAAEFGMTGGGVINLVTKSGTNQFRGTLAEFVRDDRMDATGWTNNRNNLEKAPLDYHQFGGTIGGPVLRNRSFFFFNYEGNRHDSALTQLSRVPTELERRGDFSQTLVRTSAGAFVPVQLYDPFSTRTNPGGAGFVRTAFPSTTLPGGRLDPVARRAVEAYPLPNRTPDDPTGRNNFISNAGTISDSNQYNFRLDHQISARNRLFFRYSQVDHANTGNPPVFSADNIADPGYSLQTRHNKSATFGDTHAFGARIVNELRLAVSRQYLLSEPAGYNIDATGQLGLPASIPNVLYPRFEIGTDVTGEMQYLGSSPSQLSQRGLTVVQLVNNVSMQWGRHNFKTGVDVRVHQRNNFQPGAVSGLYDFTRAMTGNPQDTSGNTGFGLATFLLGAVSRGSLNSALSRADTFQYYGGFVQDDYRLRPNLTLNLGLRYDVITAPKDRFDRYSNFNPTANNPLTGTAGVLQYAGVDFGSQVYDTNYNNLGPRVGFAWDVAGTSRTVVRGGYGILYYHSAVFEYPDTQGFSVATQFQSPQGATFPGFQLSAGPPQILQPSGNSLGAASFLGNNVTYFERERPTPNTQQWNLTVQHELRRGLLVEASYAGSHGTHIMGYSYDLNQLDPQYYGLGLALEDRVPNPFFGIIPPGTSLSAATITRRQSLRPFPAYLNVNVTNPPLGRTKYNSGQIKVERRFSQGVGFLTSYTLARLTGDVGRNLIDFGTIGGAPQSAVMCAQNAKFDRQSCYSIEPQDVTHQLVASGLYDLPFGTGRRYLSSGVLGAIVGGFRVNAILSLRSGLPLVIRGANNGGFADRPDLVGDPEGEKTLTRWFNTSAFAAAAPFSIGSTPRALDSPRGPGFASVDFALVREIGLGQPRTLQLRAEAFNLFNRVNFNQPNVNFLSGDFGQVTSAGDGRRVQLGVKLYF